MVRPTCVDGFLTVLSPDGGTILYSTYLGGPEVPDAVDAVALRDGSVYIAGATYSPAFPASIGSYQPLFAGPTGYSDGFVAKFSGFSTVSVSDPADSPPRFGLAAAPIPYSGGVFHVRLANTGTLAGAVHPVTLALYAIDGRLVRTLGTVPGGFGAQSFTWDGTDTSGRPVGTGVYYLRASAGALTQTIEVTVVR